MFQRVVRLELHDCGRRLDGMHGRVCTDAVRYGQRQYEEINPACAADRLRRNAARADAYTKDIGYVVKKCLSHYCGEYGWDETPQRFTWMLRMKRPGFKSVFTREIELRQVAVLNCTAGDNMERPSWHVAAAEQPTCLSSGRRGHQRCSF